MHAQRNEIANNSEKQQPTKEEVKQNTWHIILLLFLFFSVFG